LEVGKQFIALVLPVWFCVCCLKDFPFSFAVPNVTKMEQERPYYAVIAGLCASFASLFGKLTANSGRLLEHAGLTALPAGETLVQAVCFLTMVLLNGCVWRFFVKALHAGSGSTLRASLASAATNYVASALLGTVLFNEQSSLLWWLGTALVLAGLLLIIGGSEEKVHEDHPGGQSKQTPKAKDE
uniref:EamA domain-containing protein n=1 Tax=Anopheles coluzzii TaxID=1518534 RepID=A0A8W7PIM4_ANOCL